MYESTFNVFVCGIKVTRCIGQRMFRVLSMLTFIFSIASSISRMLVPGII